MTHNGIALICRPGVEDDKDQPGRKTKDKEKENRKREKGTGQNIAGRQDCLSVRAVLKKELGLTVVDLESPEARLSGSDVLFTGRHVYFYTTLRPFSGQQSLSRFLSLQGILCWNRFWYKYRRCISCCGNMAGVPLHSC